MASRYFILIAVFGSLLSSIAAIVYSTMIAVYAFFEAFREVFGNTFSEEGSHHLAVSVINSVDVMLLGTVLYLVAFGLYELFIDFSLQLPRWMKVTDIDALKGRLLSVVVVMAAVNFLARLVEWRTGEDILFVGLAIGAFYAGIGVLFIVGRRNEGGEQNKSMSAIEAAVQMQREQEGEKK
jgi:uncharacterized membrane protein YqhA